MKKFLSFIIISLTAVSCVLNEGGMSRRDATRLQNYTDFLSTDMILPPIQNFGYILELQAYLNLTEEEKGSETWRYIHQDLRHITDNEFMFRGLFINTGGNNLSKAGDSWTVDFVGSYGYDVYPYSSSYPGHSNKLVLTRVSADSYNFIDKEFGQEAYDMTIKTVPSSKGGYDFEMAVSGKIAEDKDGFWAKFEAKNCRYNVQVHYATKQYDQYYIAKMDFRVETYRKNESLDWCEKEYRLDYISYKSNLL